MGKVLLNLAVTLDGFIEGPRGEFDWCFTDQDYGMTDFLARCGAMVFGRKSYETLLSFDPNPYPDKAKYVFSRGWKEAPGGAMLAEGSLSEAMASIRQHTRGDIWFFGGAVLLRDFLNADLVDEMHLAVHPLLLGQGVRLFPEGMQRSRWRLLSAQTYSSGLVQLAYERSV